MKMQPLVAEFLGTFVLCFAGIAAILSATAVVGSGAGIVGIALAHGLALSVAVNAFGGISGAHFNPAVSAGFLLTGRLPASRFVPYVVVQLAGAAVAAAACRVIFPPEAVTQAQLGIPLPAAWVSTGSVLLAEFLMTFLLMTAIYGTAVDERGRAVKIGGFGIGLTVAFNILAGGAVTRVDEPRAVIRAGADDGQLAVALGVLGRPHRRRVRGRHRLREGAAQGLSFGLQASRAQSLEPKLAGPYQLNRAFSNRIALCISFRV